MYVLLVSAAAIDDVNEHMHHNRAADPHEITASLQYESRARGM